MKKLLSIMLAVTLIITAMPLGAFEFKASALTSGYYTYTVSNGKATITDVDTSISGNVTIPSTLGSYPVTSIGSSAFYYCTSLTSITIPDSVTSIGFGAFEHCTSLTNITIPDTVTSIGDAAFDLCTSLEHITIGTSVTSIGEYAFNECSRLVSITIPDSVTSIGDDAFYLCTSLTSIIIPDSVISIGGSAFYNTGYYNNADNWENIVLYIGNHLIDAKGTISDSYTIKDGTLTIADYAFSSCTRLTSITIPDSVTSIGDAAFDLCTSLENVYITDLNAWYNIEFSTSTSNPLYYADFLFLNNKPVTNVVVPEGITEITPYMFDFCTLKKITLPEGINTIGEKAFASCEILTDINIPKSVTNIEEDAFEDCQSLKNVYITDIEAWCDIEFTNYDYSNPLYYADYLYLNGELITDLTIPESVTEIKPYMFSCSNLKSVKIHNNVTKIGDYAFKDCTGLESFSLPSTVTNVGNSAFENCTSLKSVFINKNLMIIKRGAFNNCNNITDVYYEGSEEDWESVAILLNNGSLANAKVTFNATGLPGDSTDSVIGDSDNDGKINLNDLVTLAQYTAGWENLNVNKSTLDVNGDGSVNLQDVTHLARYLAGWKDYSLSQTPTVSDGWTGDYIIK